MVWRVENRFRVRSESRDREETDRQTKVEEVFFFFFYLIRKKKEEKKRGILVHGSESEFLPQKHTRNQIETKQHTDDDGSNQLSPPSSSYFLQHFEYIR